VAAPQPESLVRTIPAQSKFTGTISPCGQPHLNEFDDPWIQRGRWFWYSKNEHGRRRRVGHHAECLYWMTISALTGAGTFRPPAALLLVCHGPQQTRAKSGDNMKNALGPGREPYGGGLPITVPSWREFLGEQPDGTHT